MDEELIARRIFTEIAAEFPHLQSRIHNDDPCELSFYIPEQKGLKYAISLNLQNVDELHFMVGNFWCSWFPCTDTERAESFKNSVINYINGKYRLLDHFRGSRLVKSELQKPNNDSWQTIASRSCSIWPFPLKKSYRVVHNA